VTERPDALVFDLDGTLIDSRRDIAEAANAALVEHGRAPLEPARIHGMVGDGARALVARAFGFSNADPALDAAAATFARHYEARPCVHTTLLPGAREALSLGFPCALVTNKPRKVTLAVLEHLHILAAFGAVWCGDDGPLKPNPAGVLSVCKTLGVPPARAWMIGDGPQDIEAGRAAGCVTIAVRGIAAWSAVEASNPDRVVKSLEDLVSA
jgi:phosphoglycolate phosphatase